MLLEIFISIRNVNQSKSEYGRYSWFQLYNGVLWDGEFTLNSVQVRIFLNSITGCWLVGSPPKQLNRPVSTLV